MQPADLLKKILDRINKYHNQLFTDDRMKEVALYVLKKYPVLSRCT